MAGTLTVVGMSAGLASGSKTIGPVTVTGSSVIGEILDVALNPGDNTFAVPSGAVAVLIVPPSTSTAALKVRTNLNSTDGGLPVAAGDPFGPYSFRGLAVTSLIVNSSGSVAAVELTFI